jgi:hypothetical protein
MPRLTFAIASDGLRVPVMIGHTSTQMQAFQAAGQPLPTPLPLRGLQFTLKF